MRNFPVCGNVPGFEHNTLSSSTRAKNDQHRPSTKSPPASTSNVSHAGRSPRVQTTSQQHRHPHPRKGSPSYTEDIAPTPPPVSRKDRGKSTPSSASPPKPTHSATSPEGRGQRGWQERGKGMVGRGACVEESQGVLPAWDGMDGTANPFSIFLAYPHAARDGCCKWPPPLPRLCHHGALCAGDLAFGPAMLPALSAQARSGRAHPDPALVAMHKYTSHAPPPSAPHASHPRLPVILTV
ncbi:hypothetical protein B0H14DRAFT_3519073 [Mycena olivaceomarginata]|nr:hypothetical protein B0H14DRAFT_3519073 [Mycena olivaceomarginata]